LKAAARKSTAARTLLESWRVDGYPADVPHYIEIEEDTVLQISGTGPSRRQPVDAAK